MPSPSHPQVQGPADRHLCLGRYACTAAHTLRPENPAFSRAGNAPARVDWTPSIYRQLSDVRIASVACAQSYMMLLSSSHQLYALGRGDYGQLGLGSGVTHVVEPTLLEDLPATTEVVCGAFHCLAVAAGGRLYSWGRSDLAGHSEGLGTYTPREVLISQGESRCRTVCASDTLTVCVCDSGQSLYHWGFSFTGEKIYKPQLLYSFDRERIRQVALGKCFGLALSETGAVFGWGDRTYGETLSCGSPLDPSYTLLPRRLRHRKLRGIVRVAAGERHALLMDRSGRVWSMGENMYGQCGVPPSHHCGPSPVDFPESSFVADKVACGPRHSACINSGRQLFTWGHSAGHKLIFTTAVEMLVQQQRQPGPAAADLRAAAREGDVRRLGFGLHRGGVWRGRFVRAEFLLVEVEQRAAVGLMFQYGFDLMLSFILLLLSLWLASPSYLLAGSRAQRHQTLAQQVDRTRQHEVGPRQDVPPLDSQQLGQHVTVNTKQLLLPGLQNAQLTLTNLRNVVGQHNARLAKMPKPVVHRAGEPGVGDPPRLAVPPDALQSQVAVLDVHQRLALHGEGRAVRGGRGPAETLVGRNRGPNVVKVLHGQVAVLQTHQGVNVLKDGPRPAVAGVKPGVAQSLGGNVALPRLVREQVREQTPEPLGKRRVLPPAVLALQVPLAHARVLVALDRDFGGERQVQVLVGEDGVAAGVVRPVAPDLRPPPLPHGRGATAEDAAPERAVDALHDVLGRRELGLVLPRLRRGLPAAPLARFRGAARRRAARGGERAAELGQLREHDPRRPHVRPHVDGKVLRRVAPRGAGHLRHRARAQPRHVLADVVVQPQTRRRQLLLRRARRLELVAPARREQVAVAVAARVPVPVVGQGLGRVAAHGAAHEGGHLAAEVPAPLLGDGLLQVPEEAGALEVLGGVEHDGAAKVRQAEPPAHGVEAVVAAAEDEDVLQLDVRVPVDVALEAHLDESEPGEDLEEEELHLGFGEPNQPPLLLAGCLVGDVQGAVCVLGPVADEPLQHLKEVALRLGHEELVGAVAVVVLEAARYRLQHVGVEVHHHLLFADVLEPRLGEDVVDGLDGAVEGADVVAGGAVFVDDAAHLVDHVDIGTLHLPAGPALLLAGHGRASVAYFLQCAVEDVVGAAAQVRHSGAELQRGRKPEERERNG
ncbi:regulator of chromosome condensation, putative [Babesia caballi]|uniref:Regulator of chromosome condensation, putative n=1 Tax=Babesia caballi TaxID=5871 RepID=A0AAV4LSS9_BABCB|nr:regulator of chromosome condensation, putative [Babesia caballi]